MLGFAALFFAPLAANSSLPPGTPFAERLVPIGLTVLAVLGYLGVVLLLGWLYHRDAV